MREHPRRMLVADASHRLARAFLDELARCPELTYVELLGIIHGIQGSWLKRALRDERQPDDPDGPADID